MSLLHPQAGHSWVPQYFLTLAASFPAWILFHFPIWHPRFPPSAKPKARVQLRSPRVGQLKAKEGVLVLRETQQQNSPHKAGLPLET